MIKKEFLFSIIFLIILSLSSIWIALSFYEKSVPSGAINIYLKNIQKGNLKKLPEITDFIETDFIKRTDYIDYLIKTYKSYAIENLKYVKEYSKEKDSLKYSIYSDITKISTVELTKSHDKYYVKTLPEYKDYTICAPKGALVSINGTQITDDYISDISKFNFSLLKSEANSDVVTYSINYFAFLPDVVASFNGFLCPCEINGSEIVFYLSISDSEKNTYEGTLKATANLYARYVNNDAPFAELAKHLFPNTSYYKELRTFFNGWYNHSGYEIRNETISNVKKLSENAFVGEINFDYIVLKGKNEFLSYSSYKIPFVKKDNKWLAVSIEVQ